jgi:hypothetical protein
MTIQDNGSTANAGAVSENVPVTVGTSYAFTVSASYSGFFSGGFKLTLTWYQSGGTQISAVTATSGTLSPGAVATISTAVTAAPVNAAYAIATVAMNGLPGESNVLSVYAAQVAPAGSVPVNVNYAFTWTSWPWAPVNGATLGWQVNQALPGNSDSLVLGGVIELMGGAGGVPCTAVPELLDSNGQGPRYRILAPPSMNSAAYGYETSYDLNAPQPTQDVVASMLLDGERPFGTRASNRTISLPVIIFGTLAGGMRQVMAAREYLMSVIDQQVWQITWTSADTGKPLVYDCFRALPSVPLYGFNYSSGGTATGSGQGRPNFPAAVITLTVQALPYGRSDADGIQSLAFQNSLINAPVPPGSQGVDNFSAVTGGQGWVQDSTKFVQGGTASIRYDAPVPISSPYPAAAYSRVLSAPVSIIGLPALAVWLGQAYDTQWPASPSFVSNVTLAFTLTDGNGRTLSFSKTQNAAAWGASPATPKWTLVTAPVPQGTANFNYGDVVSYKVTVTNWAGSGNTGLVRMHAWLNDLVAVPQTVANSASPRGVLYNLFSLPGSARAPVNVQCQLPATAPVTQEITTPASGSWIVPPAVYQLEAECWGGGGAGATVNQNRPTAGGGGGGAEYAAEPVLQVVPGTAVPYSLGAGGTPSQEQDTVIDLTTPGLHSWLCPANVTSVLVECWGGGAAGAAGSGGGGAGGYGSATVTTVPGTTYLLSVGAGGLANTGTTSADNAARNGGPSWFGDSSATGVSNALVAASGGISPATGNGNGGTGGDNDGCPGTIHWPGGNGGHAPGGGGGGGGGCGGRNGRGHHGHAPWTNGAGAAWCGPGQGGDNDGDNDGDGFQHGGGGGGGASAPGTPSQGGYPGGGGGGGFCGAYFQLAVQAVQATPGQAQVNYMGANGANGLVQLTYAIGNGNPVNGSPTAFGSSATTGVVVTANGGASVAINGATGAAGGSGSTNTVHQPGGSGGLDTGTSMGSWMLGPQVTTLFQTLASFTYSAASHTSGTAASSCAQGGAVVLVESAAPAFDLSVTDSAGNVYVNQGQQGGGTLGATGCVYAFTSPVSFPITTSTTLTVSSATSQQYGAIWYASPWITDATGTNTGAGSGTGTAVSGQFGVTDTVSAQYELVVAFNATNQSFGTPTFGGKLWYAPGSTSSLTAGSLAMQAYVGLSQAGGTGGANGDAFAQTLGGSSSWAVLCIPLAATAQQAYAPKLDWRAGTTPGASTTWGIDASVSAEGMIAVVGMAGSGSGITAGPSAVSDQGGNVYTVQNTTLLPSNGGVMFLATAPVTASMTQGASGTVSWGHASGAPNYWTAAYWIPNATGLDGVSAVTGSSSTPGGVFAPSATNDMAFAVFGNAVVGPSAVSAAPAPWNYIDNNSQSYLDGQTWACQVTDRTAVTASGSLGTSAPWGLLLFGFAMNVRAAGGGAAGGPNQGGYPSTFYAGGPGYSGGGKGGLGAQSLNTNGGGASLPGGGGGGSFGATTTSIPGGQGGQGAVRVTYSPPLTPFNTLVVHRPGQSANQNLNPLVPIPFSDVPNNTEYVVRNAVQPNVNAVFNSTYTLILVNHQWDSATLGSARTITVSVHQYEYPGGPASSVQVSRSVTPATDIVNGMVNMGEVTLPVKDYAKFNDQSYFTVSINDTDQSDRFQDVLFLDTTGQTVLINIDPSQPGYNTYVNYYIDEPTPDRDLGFIGGTCQDRQHNVSLMEYSFISGGPLYIGAGDNLLLTYSPAGAPSLGLSYAPRWYIDRTV